MEDYLKFVVDFAKGRESLITLDDCASTKSVKDRILYEYFHNLLLPNS